MQRYLIKGLFEVRIPKAVKLTDFCDVVVLSCCSDMEINLRVFFVVLIDDGAD
jgi:hypothetical protein